MTDSSSPRRTSRRDFLKTSSGAVLTGAAIPLLSANVHVAGNEALRVGLVGCGGRGTGAARQALNADPEVRLVALGDAFPDRVERSLEQLTRREEIAARVDVPPERRFAGFDAFQNVIDSGVDVVLLATPPHFRPQHLQAAVTAGKHVFVEKPVAVDAPGVRRVLATCEEAMKKGLSIVSGLCYRYHQGRIETLSHVHDGMIGEIVAMHTNYITGELWHRGHQPEWSEMENQMRNWLYYTWLSGDHIVEQHIHSLDVMAWAMHDRPPTSAVSLGGRQKRTDPEYGHIYDHFSTIYQYDGGLKGFSFCRQQSGCANETNDYIIGTKGNCNVFRHTISGETNWSLPRQRIDMYQAEHDAFFASIRAGQPINNGDYMCKSTLMAIMGRMAAYTGQTITWDQAMNSQEDLTPEAYEWVDIPVPPVAVPGITKFS